MGEQDRAGEENELEVAGTGDELMGDLEAKRHRDPVAPAKRSESALNKIAEPRRFPDGSPVHSLRTLLQNLGIIVRNTCVPRPAKEGAPGFELDTRLSSTQHQALHLLWEITA